MYIVIAASRWHILKLKCTKFDFGLGTAEHWGPYDAAPDPLAGFHRPAAKGKRVNGQKIRQWRGDERRGKERKEKN